MSLELRWKASVSATGLQAVLCWRAGIAPADPSLAAVLDAPAAALVRELEDAGWPVDAVLAHLAGLAA